MAAGHAELVGEMVALEKMAMVERLKHAKKRRSQQLKSFAQYEKHLMKEKSKKRKSHGNSATLSHSSARLRFDPSILLLEATMRNDIDEVSNLLKAGVDPNVSNEDGLRALHQCSIDNLDEIMKLLIKSGANTNVCDTELWTPLHAAATCGHYWSCKYLIEHEANLLAVNSDGNMPYDLCEDAETLDYIESEMAKRGVTQETIDDIRLSSENKMLTDLKEVEKNGGDLEYRGSNGETPIHVAACNGYVHVTEFLLDHKVSVNVPDDDEWMPLHCAACWGQLQVLELLLQHGADFEAKTKTGETTLDLCEDIETKQRVLDIMEDIENKLPNRSKDNSMKRRNSAARRGSTATAHAMRRTNPNEKSSIAQREAQEEASLRLRENINELHDEDDEDDIVLNAITLPQLPLVDANNISTSLPDVLADDQTTQKPIKSIISKNSSDRNSKNILNGSNDPTKSIPGSENIWMANEDETTTKKNKSSLDAVVGKFKGQTQNNDMTTKDSSTANGKNNKKVTSLSAEVTGKGAKSQAQSDDTSKTGKVEAPTEPTQSSRDGTKDGKTAVEGADFANSGNTQTQPNGENLAASGRSASIPKSTVDFSNKRNSSYVVDNSFVVAQAPAGATLADLKQQRAKERMAKEQPGKMGNVNVANGGPTTTLDVNDRNGNSKSLTTPTKENYVDAPHRKYSNTQEVVEGRERNCCCLIL